MVARYTSLDLCRATLRAPTDTRTMSWAARGEFDDLLLLKIEAAESTIDDICGRRFDTVVNETRSFPAVRTNTVITDDYAVTPTKVAGATSGDVTEWTPMIRPRVNRSGFGVVSDYNVFLRGEVVDVTADWGWDSVPPAIKEAATLYAVRLFNRADSPVGLQVGDMGAAYITRSDADVVAMLAPYCGRGKLG